MNIHDRWLRNLWGLLSGPHVCGCVLPTITTEHFSPCTEQRVTNFLKLESSSTHDKGDQPGHKTATDMRGVGLTLESQSPMTLGLVHALIALADAGRVWTCGTHWYERFPHIYVNRSLSVCVQISWWFQFRHFSYGLRNSEGKSANFS